MILTSEILAECAQMADTVPQPYRVAAFEKLIDDAMRSFVSVHGQENVPSTAPHSESREELSRIVIEAEKFDRKLLAAIRLLELEGDHNGAPVARIGEMFKRYRVKQPGNISRDVTSLIRRGLALEYARDNRRLMVSLTNQGIAALKK